MGQWPLVFFTIASQIGIGLLVMSYIVREINGENTKKIYNVVAMCTAVSMVISLTDLGNPLGAYRAVFNVFSSWLSREIFLLGCFFGCALLACIILRKFEKNYISFINLAAVFLGIGTVISMANIYYTAAIPAWMNVYTHISFLSTTFILGGSLLGVLLRLDNEQTKISLKKIIIIDGIIFVMQLAAFVPYLSYLTDSVPMSAALVSSHMGLWLLGQGCLFVGVLMGIWGLKKIYDNNIKIKMILISNFVLSLAGFFILRYLFYFVGRHMWQ